MSHGARRRHPLTAGGVPPRRARAGRRQLKTPLDNPAGFLLWRRPTLAQPIAVLPSGLQRFTSVFGMGTGGATALVSPEPRSACAARLWCAIRDRYIGRRPTVATMPIHDSRFTIGFKEHQFAGIYIQEFISAEDSRRYNRASFCFEIFHFPLLPRSFRGSLLEK